MCPSKIFVCSVPQRSAGLVFMTFDSDPLTHSSPTLSSAPPIAPDAASRPPLQQSTSTEVMGNDRLAPLIYWLVDSLRPSLVVEIGGGDQGALAAARQAAMEIGLQTQCIAVAARRQDATSAVWPAANVRDASPTEAAKSEDTNQPACEFRDGSIDLLLVVRPDAVQIDGPPWRAKLSERAVVLQMGTAAGGSPFDAALPIFRFNQPDAAFVGVGLRQVPQLQALFESTTSPGATQVVRALFERLSRSARQDAVMERLLRATSEAMNGLRACELDLHAVRESLDRAGVPRVTPSALGNDRTERATALPQQAEEAARPPVVAQAGEHAQAFAQAIRARDAAVATQRDLESRLAARHAEIAKLVDLVASLQDRLATEPPVSVPPEPSATGSGVRNQSPPETRAALAGAYRRMRRWVGSLTRRRRTRVAGADVRACRESGLFDEAWYLSRYPDVKASGAEPIEHFLIFGGAERRDPGPKFNTTEYLRLNPDVATSNVNPLLHYLRHGAHEGRDLPTGYRLPSKRHGS